jgi:uncharacterized protein
MNADESNADMDHSVVAPDDGDQAPVISKEEYDRRLSDLADYLQRRRHDTEHDTQLHQLLQGMDGRLNSPVSWDDETLLHLAAKQGLHATAELLLQLGASASALNSSAESPLYYASHFGHPNVVTLLISSSKSKIDQKSARGLSPLMIASRNGHVEVVSQLLQAGADVGVTDGQGRSALDFACRHGHLKIAGMLLDKDDSNLNQVNRVERMSALYWAIRWGYENTVKFLLDRGARTDRELGPGMSPIMLATEGKRAAVLRVLLDQRYGLRHFLEEADAKGATPLITATILNYDEICGILIDAGAKVDAQDHNGETSLYKASSRGYDGVVRRLLRHNAQVDAHDKAGRTPLHMATLGGHYQVVGVLLEYRSNPGRLDNKGRAALHIATSSGFADIVKLLLENGAEVDELDSQRRTALHIASASDFRGDVVKILLDHGAQTSMVDDRGWTALHIACEESDPDMIDLLLDRGAPTGQVDKGGKTALHVASSRGSLSIVRRLLDHGALVDQLDGQGWTALDAAKMRGHVKVEQTLREHGAKTGSHGIPLDEAAILDLVTDPLIRNGVKTALAAPHGTETDAHDDDTATEYSLDDNSYYPSTRDFCSMLSRDLDHHLDDLQESSVGSERVEAILKDFGHLLRGESKTPAERETSLMLHRQTK